MGYSKKININFKTIEIIRFYGFLYIVIKKCILGLFFVKIKKTPTLKGKGVSIKLLTYIY
jgi:hypothetical protein